mgnify:CR=1|jgi:hypothetical protein
MKKVFNENNGLSFLFSFVFNDLAAGGGRPLAKPLFSLAFLAFLLTLVF